MCGRGMLISVYRGPSYWTENASSGVVAESGVCGSVASASCSGVVWAESSAGKGSWDVVVWSMVMIFF